MSAIERYFPDPEQDRIRDAVAAAEGKTAGEIVPYVVEASDTYEGALWKAAALGALAVALTLGLAQQLTGFWLSPALGSPVLRWAGAPLVGAALGYFLAGVIAPLRRLLVPSAVLDRRVERRAATAFLEEEIFKTRGRTGILIFLSLFERRVLVLSDEGINRRVAAAEWQEIADAVAAGIRRRRAGEALAAAIGACGELLERRGVELPEDDEDELSNELRSRER